MKHYRGFFDPTTNKKVLLPEGKEPENLKCPVCVFSIAGEGVTKKKANELWKSIVSLGDDVLTLLASQVRKKK